MLGFEIFRVRGMHLPLLGTALFLGACGHTTMQNKVVLKASNEQAYICMNDGEVQMGDEVVLYTTQCISAASGDGTRECEAQKIAEGTVTKLLNEHYSEVAITDGGSFSEGARVIRKKEFKEKFKAFLKRIN